MTDPLLSIIIPAYNEQEGITKVLGEIYAEKALSNAEIIVVDDGSTDDTEDEVKKFKNVIFIKHHTNKGYSTAIKTGIKSSKGKYVIWFDADGQHRVQDLLLVYNELTHKQLDYCIGSRDRRSHQVYNRKLGKYILRKAVQYVAGREAGDFNSGLRGFKRDVIMRYLHLLPRGFGASTTTTLLMLECGYKGEEVPIITLERMGRSSVRQVRDGFKILMLILRIFLIFRPIHFFGGIGGAAILAGSAYGFYEATIYRLGFPVFAAIMIIFGIQSLFFGLICDQVSSLIRERFE